DHLGASNLMRDPWARIQLAFFKELDNARELAARGVAGAEEGQLAAVEVGVVEGNVALEQADEDQPAAVGDIREGALHRLAASGGVEDGRGQVAASDGLDCVQDVGPSLDRVRHLQLLPAESEAVLRHVQHDYARAG